MNFTRASWFWRIALIAAVGAGASIIRAVAEVSIIIMKIMFIVFIVFNVYLVIMSRNSWYLYSFHHRDQTTRAPGMPGSNDNSFLAFF
jgi:hypothetical protein